MNELDKNRKNFPQASSRVDVDPIYLEAFILLVLIPVFLYTILN